MSETDLRIDPLTGAWVVVTPWRQHRPNLPDGLCPFCPGGLEAPGPYDVLHIPNRWPGLPDGCHEVILHSPDHDSSFPALGGYRSDRVVELWSARTAVLGSREDVGYVFVFENRGRMIGTTIDHPRSHVADLPTAGPQLRTGLGMILVDSLTRLERLLGPDAPYMLWIHQRPAGRDDWPTAHLHLHLAPVLRAPGVSRHLAAAELGAGVFFDPVDPQEAAAQLRSSPGDGTAEQQPGHR